MLLHMHIPKTAGASIVGGLENVWGSDRVLRRDWFDELIRYSKQFGLHKFDVLSCHISARELPYLADDFNLQIFTFLRDPVARVLSTYRFWKQNNADVMLDSEIGRVPLVDPALNWQQDLERLLVYSDRVWKFREIVDTCCWQLSTSLYERKSISSNEAFKRAQRALKGMSFVGFQDQLASDFETFCHQMHPQPKSAILPEINRTDKRTTHQIDSGLEDLIRRYNQQDLDLYDWAKQRF